MAEHKLLRRNGDLKVGNRARLFVYLGIAAVILASCAGPAPGSESALRAKAVKAKELGRGWIGAGLYARTTIAIPCISGPCNGPGPRGNAFQYSFNNNVIQASFQETVAWFSNSEQAFDAIRRNAPGIAQAVGVPTRQAPRIGSAEQLGLVYGNPSLSYNLIYFVADNGYIAYFVYMGPKSGAVAMEMAVKRFS